MEILIFSSVVIITLLCFVGYQIVRLRKYITESINQISIDVCELRDQITNTHGNHRQLYTDIMTEILNIKDVNDERLKEETDSLFDIAKAYVISINKASASILQRKLGIGYSRAAKLIDRLEEEGVISSANGSATRVVLLDKNTDEDEESDGI